MKSVYRSIVVSSTTSSLVQALPFARIFTHFGWADNIFQCKEPSTTTGFNPQSLEGKWHQVAATWGENTFGCLTYNFIIDDYNDIGEAPDFTLEVNWTKFFSYVNPFERGVYGAKYNLSSEPNGRLCDKDVLSAFEPTYSWILATDYETYIIEYTCQQAYGDFLTQDYVDIFVKDPET